MWNIHPPNRDGAKAMSGRSLIVGKSFSLGARSKFGSSGPGHFGAVGVRALNAGGRSPGFAGLARPVRWCVDEELGVEQSDGVVREIVAAGVVIAHSTIG